MSNRSYDLIKFPTPQSLVKSGGDRFCKTGSRILAAQIKITENKILKES